MFERRCRSGAHAPPQALRALIQCMPGSAHNPPIVSGRSDAVARGFRVSASMPRVAPDREVAWQWAPCLSPGARQNDATSAEHGIDATPGLPAQVARALSPACRKACGERNTSEDACKFDFLVFLIQNSIPKSLLFDVKRYEADRVFRTKSLILNKVERIFHSSSGPLSALVFCAKSFKWINTKTRLI